MGDWSFFLTAYGEKDTIISRRKKEKVWGLKKEVIKFRGWMIFNIGWTILYLGWRIFYTVPTDSGIFSLVAGIALLVVEILGMLEALVHYFNMSNIKYPKFPEVEPEDYPEVDVLIATYNEPIEILYRTVNGCVHMDYPDKSKVHIYFCDDGSRKEVEELAAQMHIGYIKREEHKGAKAGNLNHAMTVTSSPYIATFDADMIPKHNFLMVTMAYFADQEKKNKELPEDEQVHLGFIQTPQTFYNPDLFQYNLFSEDRIPNEQDYFYKDVQVSRNKSNSVIYGGSNTVISRRALEDVGGFYEKSITEDFATGILIQKKGYICYALNEVLASGLSPTDLKALINQRVRWARGCICTGRKMHLLFTPKLKFGQRANYLASVWYWYASWKRFIYIMSPILFAAFGVLVVRCTLVEVLIFWFPMYISSNICLKMMSHNIRTTKWTNVYETVLFPFLMIPTLLETFGISMKKFKVTKKGGGDEEKERTWHYAIPHIILAVLSCIGIINCVRWTFDTGSIDYFVILFWLITNLYNIVMSIFFIMGRKAYRKYERMTVKKPCEITNGIVTVNGMSLDASEGGISILLKKPEDFDDEEDVYITLLDKSQKARVKGKVVLVTRQGDMWKYVFSIEDMLESRSEYTFIIYDNFTSMPVNLDESTSSFDDLRLNITRRAQKNMFKNRKMARIPVTAEVETESGLTVKIKNYNYKYLLISYSGAELKELVLPLKKELVVEAVYDEKFGDSLYLYRVTNYRMLHENPEKQRLIHSWIEECIYQDEEKQTQKISLKKQRVLALDEFSEMNYL